MKVSEMISELLAMEKTYGDLDVCVSLEVNRDMEKGQIVSEENLTFSYNQMSEEKEEIGIQNFPY
jgi:hypothetical protein